MSAGVRIIVILPFAPEERQAHDGLIAAACALHKENPAAELDIVQLVPMSGGIEARTLGDAARWWECASPSVADPAEPATLAALAAEALSLQGLSAEKQRLILMPPGPQGEELAALLAADLDGCSLGRCTALALAGATVIGRRPVFGGRLMIELRSQAAVCCATWRPASAHASALQAIPDSAIRRLPLTAPAAQPQEVELVQSADAQPRLEGASLVVSGGRGMDGPEGFELLTRVAASVGAAVGGSLPAVDAGWVPVARQIGQSGKFVAPRLYFAVGISGTPQHLAGVSGSARIVALNKDPEAAIFAMAEAGVVGDWRVILPLLLQRLESRQPGS